MQHRFFLVAPGDFVTTPKLAEAVAMGGAGGPIPVLVLPGGARDARAFPYSSWIDYCEVAFVVSARTAKDDLRGVLDRLSRVGAAEAAAKHAALRRLSAAFTVVPGSTVRQPSAAEHVMRGRVMRFETQHGFVLNSSVVVEALLHRVVAFRQILPQTDDVVDSDRWGLRSCFGRS